MKIKKVLSLLISEEEIPDSTKKWIGMICTIIAFIIVVSTVKIKAPFWWPFSHDKSLWNYMGIYHGILGFVLMIPLYTRNYIRFSRISVYSVVSFSLNWLMFASITALIIGKGLKADFMGGLLIAVILISWLGMKSIAGFGWLLLFPLAIYNITKSSISFGGWAIIYLISVALSIIFQTNTPPGELTKNIIRDFRIDTSNQLEHIRDSVNSSLDVTGKVVKTAVATSIDPTLGAATLIEPQKENKKSD